MRVASLDYDAPRASFTFAPTGDGQDASPHTVWLAYPSQYTHGVSLSTASASAIKISHAPEFPRCIKIDFDPSQTSEEVRLDIEPRSEGLDEVWLQGEKLEAVAAQAQPMRREASTNGIIANGQPQAATESTTNQQTPITDDFEEEEAAQEYVRLPRSRCLD
jgi:hypothetical protein